MSRRGGCELVNNQIILHSGQKVECLILSSAAFNENEKQNFITKPSLDWAEYPQGKILCNFENNLVSSLLPINQAITAYEISKRENNDNFFTKVATLTEEDISVEGEYFKLKDYNVRNNSNYLYRISPLTANTVQTTLENSIITKWDSYTLSPIIKTAETDRYEIVKDEYDIPIIWNFQLNCSESDITLNQDKTMFTTFAKKPKVAIGALNYCTGSFSCLLGNTLYNDCYYEPTVILDKWNKMIETNHLYLFKNVKGDSMVIYIESGAKRKYMNEALNYYISTFDGVPAITDRPTTIDFSYVEIMDSKNIQIYE